MTRKESLDILKEVNKKIDSMTDEELYDHMVKTSPSFRKTLRDLDDFCKEEEIRELMDWMVGHYGMGNKIYFTPQFKDEESLHKFAESIYDRCMNKRKDNFKLVEELDMDNEIFDEYGNYKFNWVPKSTPTDVSTTGGSPVNYGVDWLHPDSQTTHKSSSKTYNAGGLCDDMGVIDGDRTKPTPKMEDLKSNFHNPFKPDGNWTADNKTDKANLDAIDNKADPGPRGKEKITPIKIKDLEYPRKDAPWMKEEEDKKTPIEIKLEPRTSPEQKEIGKKDEKFRNICLNEDIYCKIVDALDGYISLIHDNICGLVSYRFSNAKDVLELAEKLVKAEDTLNLVRDTFRPDRACAVLDDAHNIADTDFLMEQLEKAMQVPENKAKIWNAVLSANVYKKDITAEEKEKKE